METISSTFLPKVSCICPTFARAYLLEEAIESFHRQDYAGEKELIICNDFVDQELIYDHPDVKVINLPERAPNLGSKRNAAYSYATGDVFLTWGDDDIHLPNRISRMVKAMKHHNSEFVFEGPYYILYGGKLSFERGKTSGAHIITKKLFYDAGKIPEINSGEDQAFNAVVKRHLKITTPLPVCQDVPQFLYRYSTGRVHISQFGEDRANKKSGYQTFLEQAKEYVRQGKEPSGRYELKPHWSKDWTQEVKRAIIK
jgi:glycosyltransferase involved in cell wall biosynthesis